MESIEYMISAIDSTLDTKRKRRLVGGILLSASLFLGGLAVTTLTIKDEEWNYEKNNN